MFFLSSGLMRAPDRLLRPGGRWSWTSIPMTVAVVPRPDGRYVLVSDANPKKRDPLVLSISDDGMVFNKMGYLTGGYWVDYPHVIEHDGNLLIAYAGHKKQACEVLKVRIEDLRVLDGQK